MSGEASPLKIFVQAKGDIVDIFREIHSLIDYSCTCVKDFSVNVDDLVNSEQLDLVFKYATKTEGILEILQRDRMKVAFFGRTSNGKSTVINAMLKTKILPSGIGHTTNCFVQVEGTDSKDGYIITEDAPNERRNVDSISHLANALSKVKLGTESLVRICWPKNKCNLLKDDVILVDSPGIDVSPDIDTWIDKFCLDADVFVLVVNAESTLMQTEKNFFHRVSSRLSKPNIFILNNRWDASATEPETIEEVKQQHLERNISFLSKELCVMEQHEAEERVFFVSALEMLQSSSDESQKHSDIRIAGYQSRLMEFTKFEGVFQECISKTALHLKFAQHSVNGKVIASDLISLWMDLFNFATSKRYELWNEFEEKKNQLDLTDQNLTTMTDNMKEKINWTTCDLHKAMSSALLEEIRRLPSFLEEFDRSFDPDPNALDIYKKELNFHTEECLSRNLHFRYSSFAQNALSETAKYMHDGMFSLLPELKDRDLIGLLPSRSFEMTYHFDCPGLCSGFCEDIEFRFSLGITSLVYKFLGPKHLRGYTQIPRSLSPAKNETSDLESSSSSRSVEANDALMTFLNTFTSVTSGTTIGSLAFIAIIGKAVGWRLITLCTGLYGVLYLYERLTWTTKAKEEAFKRQYVDFVTSQLAQVVELISRNCSHQVKQELNSVLSRICHHIEQKKNEMHNELKNVDENIHRLDDVTTKAEIFKSKMEVLTSKLDHFILKYLQSTSRI